MVVDKIKTSYFFYVLLILFSYIQSVNVITLEIKWILNKFSYIVVVFFIFLMGNRVKKLNKNEYFSLFFIFIFVWWFFISNLNVLSSGDAIINTISNGILYFFTFLIFLISVKSYSIKYLLMPFVICSSIVIFISFLMFFGVSIPYYFDDSDALEMYLNLKDSTDLIGFSGVYLNQNSLGSTLIVAIFSYFSLYNYEFDKNNKIFAKTLMFMICLSLILLVLTVSRAAILAIAFLMVLYFIKGFNSKRNVIIFSLLIVFLIFSGLYFYNIIVFLIERVKSDGTSFRSDIWVDAISSFRNNYIFGVGDYRYETFQGSWSAHNVYIQRLVSNGVFVAISWYLWILMGLLISIKKLIFLNFYENKINIVFSCTLISILIHQCFESMITNTFLPITLALFLIISYNLLASFQKSETGNHLS